MDEEQFAFSGDDFFKTYYPLRTNTFFNSKLFKSELLKKCIPDDFCLHKKYIVDDIFFMPLIYFHTTKYFHAGKIDPIYDYYVDIGFYSSKEELDYSLERIKGIGEVLHDCWKYSYLKMIETRPLDFAETYYLVNTTTCDGFEDKLKTIFSKYPVEKLKEYRDVVHEYLFADGIHVVNGFDEIKIHGFIKRFEALMRIK
jgi:hypothetical protein